MINECVKGSMVVHVAVSRRTLKSAYVHVDVARQGLNLEPCIKYSMNRVSP